MPTIPHFADALGRAAVPRGWLAVVSLANFRPIGSWWGIPTVERAGGCLGEVIVRSAPAGTIIGHIAWFTFAASLPGATVDDMTDFITAVHSATLEEDLQTERDEWVEIRAAIGTVEVRGDEPSVRHVVSAACRDAQKDLARYPAEWTYTIGTAD